jgi:hypothetical protein
MPGEVHRSFESRVKLSSHRPSYADFVRWAKERAQEPEKVNAKEALQQYLEAKEMNTAKQRKATKR